MPARRRSSRCRPGARWPRWSPGSSRRGVFVALGRANAVAVVDAARDSVIALIPVGARVWGLGMAADGTRLYTANGISNDISVIDTRTLQVVATIKAGDGPWGVAIG